VRKKALPFLSLSLSLSPSLAVLLTCIWCINFHLLIVTFDLSVESVDNGNLTRTFIALNASEDDRQFECTSFSYHFICVKNAILLSLELDEKITLFPIAAFVNPFQFAVHSHSIPCSYLWGLPLSLLVWNIISLPPRSSTLFSLTRTSLLRAHNLFSRASKIEGYSSFVDDIYP